MHLLLLALFLAGGPRGTCAKPPVLTLTAPTSGVAGQPLTVSGQVRPATGQPSCAVAQWALAYGDGDGISGNAAVRLNDVHTYFTNGTYTIELTAQSASGVPSPPTNVRIVIGDAPPLPPPPADARGPQPTIACPADAIPIVPGQSIQAAVTAQPAGTAFRLNAGVHPVTGAITPKTGDTFCGEYGAVLDGTGWATTDPTQGAFRAHNQDIDDVTILNLVIRNMPQKAIHAYRDSSDRWLVDQCEIIYTKWGVALPNVSALRNSVVRYNVGPDPRSSNTADRGGGYSAYLSADVLIENNEIAYNGPEQKLMNGSGAIFRKNWFHHNVLDGIWLDGENTNFLVEDNLSEDNGREGIFSEVNGNGIIRRNTSRRNANNGIFVATSSDNQVYENVVEDNYRAIQLMVDCARVGQGGEQGVFFDLRNNTVRDNVIVVGTGSGVAASVINHYGCSAAQLEPYVNGSMNNTFEHDSYDVPTVTGAYWFAWGQWQTWAQWQARGQDTTGSVQ